MKINLKNMGTWNSTIKKKLQTCEEGWVDLRISFWHLSMKNNYLLKKTVEVGQ